MEYHRITDINDPYFRQMHDLMGTVFPPEEVLDYKLWEETLKDPGIRVFVAVKEGSVVGATEYRYYEGMQVAMTDFTIIGRDGLGIGPFLAQARMADLQAVVEACGGKLLGMFAEIYNPSLNESLEFGGIHAMNPFVRREVLAHLGYRKLDFEYVHPSWHNDGEAVSGLDLCFMPLQDGESVREAVPAALIRQFLKTYYAVLPQKPAAWYEMVEGLERRDEIALLPI
ncbi:GNAT family N-acetyltransferase [Paenibacillus filicis]|uniref:GNAT family N-acetyltransferase n=1 Tax=Paenibacillus gyeongsangnamensis TaxID=3388067 RepID=A0ABT4QB00_9BACL|nr:GNAT family N-acetyltransferase [Paenibacillus filicis]MCZ8514069.1 GNAT family N-acetyltransferase [Paenibacillus filicis]